MIRSSDTVPFSNHLRLSQLLGFVDSSPYMAFCSETMLTLNFYLIHLSIPSAAAVVTLLLLNKA